MIRSTLRLSGLMMAGVLLAACGGDDGADPVVADDGEASAAGKSVCFVTAASAHFYVTPWNEAAQEEADNADIELTTLSAEFDVQTGAEQLNQCISQGADAIMLWPLDPAAYIPGLTRAEEAGIPVVLVDSPMNEQALELVTSFTGADKEMQGALSAEALSEALDGQGNIVVIAGQAGNGTTIARTDGFTEKLPEVGPDMNILETVNADFDQQTALVVSRDLLTKYGDEIDGVYAQDDAMALGFADAYDEAGITKEMVIIGIGGTADAFDLIEAGRMHSTILQSPTEDGRLGMLTTIRILNGETVPERIFLDMPVVTAETIGEFEPVG